MRTNNNIDRGGFPAPRFLHGKQNGIVKEELACS